MFLQQLSNRMEEEVPVSTTNAVQFNTEGGKLIAWPYAD